MSERQTPDVRLQAEHPIIFTGESVPAIIDGRKTMTRRVVKLGKQVPLLCFTSHGTRRFTWCDEIGRGMAEDEGVFVRLRCPFGVPGDRLWVKETWQRGGDFEVTELRSGFRHPVRDQIYYAADDNGFNGRPWRSPIFMPRSASRLTLEVVAVRVERLQEMNRFGAREEGFRQSEHQNPMASFRAAWQRLNAKRGYQWESNPWVWAITFRRVSAVTA